MSEQYQSGNFFDYLVDSFWASLPERAADDLAACKKDLLTRIKSAVDSIIDQEINWTERHLENARRMRDQYRRRTADAPPPNPS
jgi:hypothetical protein